MHGPTLLQGYTARPVIATQSATNNWSCHQRTFLMHMSILSVLSRIEQTTWITQVCKLHPSCCRAEFSVRSTKCLADRLMV